MEKPATTQVTAGGKPLTTFVHTDTNSFREIVQRLTGPTEPNNSAQQEATTPLSKTMGLKRPKLHERRQGLRPKLEILKPSILIFRQPDQISPSKTGNSSSGQSLLTSPLGTPSTVMANLSIKEESNNKKEDSDELESLLNSQEEEKAIRERRFYLHPSPRSKVGYSEPELLTLFPLKSPKNE